jgi:hypothetical protein
MWRFVAVHTKDRDLPGTHGLTPKRGVSDRNLKWSVILLFCKALIDLWQAERKEFGMRGMYMCSTARRVKLFMFF